MKRAALVAALLGLIASMFVVAAPPAGALISAGCITVEGNGVCDDGTPIPVGVPGQSVGGAEVPVNSPIGFCYYVDCVEAGEELASVPVPPVTTPPVGPVTVPGFTVHTPVVDDLDPIVSDLGGVVTCAVFNEAVFGNGCDLGRYLGPAAIGWNVLADVVMPTVWNAASPATCLALNVLGFVLQGYWDPLGCL